MYLELADNGYLNDNAMNLDMLPVLDPETGEIYQINIEAFLMLSPEEQIEVVNQAPFLIQKIVEQSGGMSAGLFSRIRTGVSNFVQKAANTINPNVTPSGIPKADKPIHTMPQFDQLPQTMQFVDPMVDPKFAFSAQLEPSPKPWFARTEVLLPVIGGAALLTFLIFRRK